ncbi:cytochrome P450 3A8 [Rhipicephalus sanguineus]|uniref:cytochrome P450 3A8 n=1 Tax=Rhipicephalus sanguineus TaxID=34632 RepID=UPI00189574DF|nr:cytochrome P450 3A8 [Rhipicephalus sanguineus]
MLATVALVAWTVVVLGATIAVLQLLRWRKKHFSYFKDLGVPGPTPNIIWGNLWEYHRKGITNAIADWCEKYGDVFGFYNGDVPTLVVKDLDFLSYVLVKDFGNFMNRGTTMRTDEQHPLLGQGLLHARDLQWKRTRSVTSHAFTAAKFRQVFPHLDDACDRLLDLLVKTGDSGGKEVAAYELFKPLAMEYISRGSFGIANNFQEATQHPLFHMATQVLPGTMIGPMHMIAQCTTTLQSVVAPFLWLNSKIGSFTYDRFAKLAYKAVDDRRNNPLPDGKKDILQILLDAETEEEEVNDTVTNGVFKVDKKMSSTEVSVNTAMLLIAGFGTTSVALSFVCYMLANHLDIQERVREEVKQVRRKYGSLDYTAVTQGLKYLSCVVDETLRVFPVVVAFVTRSAREDFEYKGVKYSAGLSIMSPTMVVQKDPKAWTEPERFDPDRFLPENVAQQHGMAYQPFGQGPRNCIGKRLALIEIIYTVGRIVERFRLEPGPSQKENLELRFYSMVCEPREGPWIKFKPILDEEQA